MADLGSIAIEVPDYGVPAGAYFTRGVRLEKLVLLDFFDMQFGTTRDDVAGSPAAPSLRMTRFGHFEFAIPVDPGTRSVTVKAKQSLPATPRPRLVVVANPAVGLDEDVTADAPEGSDWVTVGPALFTVTSAGVVRVQLWCLAPGTAVECWFDEITTA